MTTESSKKLDLQKVWEAVLSIPRPPDKPEVERAEFAWTTAAKVYSIDHAQGGNSRKWMQGELSELSERDSLTEADKTRILRILEQIPGSAWPRDADGRPDIATVLGETSGGNLLTERRLAAFFHAFREAPLIKALDCLGSCFEETRRFRKVISRDQQDWFELSACMLISSLTAEWAALTPGARRVLCPIQRSQKVDEDTQDPLALLARHVGAGALFFATGLRTAEHPTLPTATAGYRLFGEGWYVGSAPPGPQHLYLRRNAVPDRRNDELVAYGQKLLGRDAR